MVSEEELKKAIADLDFAERSRGPTSDLAISARARLEALQKAEKDDDDDDKDGKDDDDDDKDKEKDD